MVRDLEMTFVLCVKSEGYGASLEVRKIYRAVPDPEASRRALLRVVDDSGEDYLYPAENFVTIAVPKEAEPVFATRAG